MRSCVNCQFCGPHECKVKENEQHANYSVECRLQFISFKLCEQVAYVVWYGACHAGYMCVLVGLLCVSPVYLVALVRSPHEFVSQRFEKVLVLDFDNVNGMWRTVYTNDGAVWQTLALTVACQEKILGAAAHFKSDFNIIAHHNGAYRQTVWGNWGYAECARLWYQYWTAHTQ